MAKALLTGCQGTGMEETEERGAGRGGGEVAEKGGLGDGEGGGWGWGRGWS